MAKLGHILLAGLAPLLVAAGPSVELSWPEPGAKIQAVALEVRGVAKGVDPATHVLVGQLTPLGRQAGWSRAVLGRTAPAPDGQFTLRLYDFVSGRYRLTVWAEPSVGGPRKGETVRTLEFELVRPSLSLVDVDPVEGVELSSTLPTEVMLKLRASPGSRVTVEIDGERVAQAQLEGPERTLMLSVKRPRSLVVVEARNIVFDASSESYELRVNPPGDASAQMAPDLGPVLERARKLCRAEDFAEVSPLLLRLQHGGSALLSEDPKLGLCAVRAWWQSNDCWAAIPLAQRLLPRVEEKLARSELRVVQAECELQERRRAVAVTSFGHLVRDIAAGRAVATPQIAARIAEGAVDAAPNPKAAQAALAPCDGARGSCILLRKIGAMAMARHFTGRLGVLFERAGCHAQVRDGLDKVLARVPKGGAAKRGTRWIDVPVGPLSVDMYCPDRKPSRHAVVVPRGGSATAPPPPEDKPLVTLRLSPVGSQLHIDDELRHGSHGVYVFNRGDSVSTLPMRIESEGRQTQKALIRLSKIPGELRFHLPNKKALTRFDAGIEARRQGHRQKALAEFNEALSMESNFSRAQLMLGLVHFERGQREAAKRALARCVSLDNDTRYTSVALMWLSALELEQWLNSRTGDGPAPKRALPEIVERLREAQEAIAGLYQALPSMNDEAVSYRDDSVYWLARGLYAEYKQRLDAGAPAEAVEQSLIEALVQWGRVPGQVRRIHGARRLSYPSPYKEEKTRVVAELQAAWAQREATP